MTHIYDLVYCDPEDRAEVEALYRERWPNAKIEDASDEIHRGRFSIEMDAELRDYYDWCIREGLVYVSFDCQLCMMEFNADFDAAAKAFMAERDAEAIA